MDGGSVAWFPLLTVTPDPPRKSTGSLECVCTSSLGRRPRFPPNPFADAVTPHGLSTRAALQIMRSGGNAVDGAIAANAVQGVVAPETCGIGGDLFALVHTPGETTPACLNASGRAGSGSSTVTLREAGHTQMPLYGPASVTIPGCVDGWRALWAKFGSRPLDELLAPALTCAINGF